MEIREREGERGREKREDGGDEGHEGERRSDITEEARREEKAWAGA